MIEIARTNSLGVPASARVSQPAHVPCVTSPKSSKLIERGDAKATNELLALVYGELRRVAAHKMASEAPGHTLQPTALVHEAWLHLGGDQQPTWQNRAHFFGAPLRQ